MGLGSLIQNSWHSVRGSARRLLQTVGLASTHYESALHVTRPPATQRSRRAPYTKPARTVHYSSHNFLSYISRAADTVGEWFYRKGAHYLKHATIALTGAVTVGSLDTQTQLNWAKKWGHPKSLAMYLGMAIGNTKKLALYATSKAYGLGVTPYMGAYVVLSSLSDLLRTYENIKTGQPKMAYVSSLTAVGLLIGGTRRSEKLSHAVSEGWHKAKVYAKTAWQTSTDPLIESYQARRRYARANTLAYA